MSTNRSTTINKLILKAALNKEPPYDSFKTLCKNPKNPKNQKMTYVDFEWRYYQFYHGNRDMTIEKSPQNSRPTTFSDLPLHILQIILAPCILSERLVLRKVSPDLRKLMDYTEFHCKEIEFGSDSGEEYYRDEEEYGISASIGFENFKIKYSETRKGCSVECMNNGNLKKYRTSLPVQKAMLTDASTILKNPKLKVDILKIDISDADTYSETLVFLKALNVKLDIRSIDIRAGDKNVRPILEFLKPRCLEKINFGYRFSKMEEFNEIAEMEQWKMAKKLECYFCEGLRMEKMVHFKEIKFSDFKFNDVNLSNVRDTLLKSDHLESCHLACWTWRDEPMHKFTVDRFLARDADYDNKKRRYPIPNSRHYFQLEYEMSHRGYFNGLKITKVLKN